MKNDSNYIDFGERGRFNIKNKLNELTGKEWIKFTKSWFIHKPPRRKETEILHPAKYPESLVKEFIEFFTKKNEWVIDPFMGTGSTLIASAESQRNCVGIELQKKYHKISSDRINKLETDNKIIPLLGSSFELNKLLIKKNIQQDFDYCITSPPYWNQLERNSIRQKNRKENGLDTIYSKSKNDLGNVKDYNEFLDQQSLIFDNIYDVMKPGGYLTIITNNIYADGRLFPLAFDTAASLIKRGNKSWILKDEKIWLHDDKPLIALGVNNAWVGNRHHQYCLIFRKDR
ncbi:MAG: site-specific DNA-methyltransferase [Ignavibacteriae bacterium]|nr:site-specific DNA-methyltransferase [Ignavibacteriota bacterium]